MMLPLLTCFTVGGFAGEDWEADSVLLRIGRSLDEGSSDSDGNSHEGPELTEPSSRAYHAAKSRFIKTSRGYTLPPKSSSITQLNLVMSVVSCHLLGRALTLPVALESFQY